MSPSLPAEAPRTVAELLAQGASRDPDAPAFLAPGRPTLTHRMLAEQVAGTADSLASLGLGRGSRIVLALPDGVDTAVAMIAVSACAIAIPVNPRFEPEALRALLRRARADAVVTTDETGSHAAHVARELGLASIRLAVDVGAPAGRFRLVGDTGRRPVATMPAQPGDIALILHTSGTTGRPKIVPTVQRGLGSVGALRAPLLALAAGDRALCMAPMFAAGTIRRNFYPVLYAGASVACTGGFDPAAFAGWLEELEPTFIVASATVFREIDHVLRERSGTVRHRLRFAMSQSMALPPDLQASVEERLGVPMLQAYATSEAGAIAQESLPPAERRRGSVGRAAHTEIAILGPGGRLLPSESVGEVLVRGPEVFAGYEDDDDATQEAFHDGWYRTGDLGRLDADGFLFLSGRVKDVVNRGGFTIAPGDVERVLQQHPDVVDAAVFGMPHPTLGEDLYAAVVAGPPASVAPEAIRGFAAERLPPAQIPTAVVVAASLPRTVNGKILRRELAEAMRPALQSTYVAPRDAIEEKVAALFVELLGVPRAGAHDNFFALGGDSLRGTRLVSRLNADFGLRLPPVVVFDSVTVAELARAVRLAVQAGGAADSSGGPADRGELAPSSHTRHDGTRA